MHKLIMKKFLIILGILLLLVIGALFVPPIFNRFTKPFFKNTVDAKEWYHQVDCENLTQATDGDTVRITISWWISPFHPARRDSLSMTCNVAKE